MEYTSIIKPPKSKQLKSGRVKLAPGEEVGTHVTTNKEELLVILRGTATLIQGTETVEVKAGETQYIGPEVEHNVKNMTDSDVEYIYVVCLFK